MTDIIKETKQVKNTAVLAGGTAYEYIITATDRVDYYNELSVINTDDVKIRVVLDDDTANIIDILPKTAMILSASEGRKFVRVKQINLDAGTNETANTIIFTAVRKEVI